MDLSNLEGLSEWKWAEMEAKQTLWRKQKSISRRLFIMLSLKSFNLLLFFIFRRKSRRIKVNTLCAVSFQDCGDKNENSALETFPLFHLINFNF